jgi:hypothetical protein
MHKMADFTELFYMAFSRSIRFNSFCLELEINAFSGPTAKMESKIRHVNNPLIMQMLS